MNERMCARTRRKILEGMILDDNPQAMLMDGYDGAIIGTASRLSKPTLVAYDSSRILSILRRRGMSHEEAVEWFEFNIAGAWVGENTPVLIRRVEDSRELAETE